MGLAGWLILTALTIDYSSGQTYSHSFSSNIGSLSPNFLFTSHPIASNSSDQLQSSSRSSQRSEQARLLRSGFFRPSLFHVVTFPNDECFDVSNQSGTCYTAAECRAYGGTGTASCAKGYGTCCIISRSCHNTTSQKVVYFKNPSYPQSDSHQNYCDLTIEVKDASVCQIRLDLLDLQLDSPTDGDCMGDKFTVSATGMATNSIPTLCGLNRNQHFYINLPQNNGQDRSVSLLLMTNSNGAYRWHIRATQIRCVSPADVNVNRQQRQLFGFGPQAELKVSLPAPPGCLQYFTTKTGVIQSFNFGQYLNNLDYAICIERLSDTCRVSFTTAPGDWSIARTDGVNNQLSAMGDAQCAFDYLMIPAASRTGFGRTYDRFCGGALNYRDNRDTSAPIVTRANGPIVLRFRTSQRTGLENRAGFRLRYEQSDVGCQLDQVDGFIDSELDDLGGGVDGGGLINPASAGVSGSIGPIGSMASNSYPSSGPYPQNYPIPGQKSRANAKRMKL